VRAVTAALAVSLLAMPAAVAQPAPAKPAEPDRQKVQAAQTLLHILGLYDGTTNGSFGPLTRKALTDYQQKLGLPLTGMPDDRTLYALHNPAAVKACTGAAVPMADCLGAASPAGALLNQPRRTEPAAAAAAVEPCSDPKVALEQCLDAVAKMDGFMKSRGGAKN
jgi:hypothetical protein